MQKINYCIIFILLLGYTSVLNAQEVTKQIIKYLEDDQLAKAEQLIAKHFKNDSLNNNYFILKGRLERRKGNYHSAETYYKRCLRNDSTFTQAMGGLAVVYLNLNDPTRALEYLNKAISLKPDEVDFYNDRSGVLFYIENYTAALNGLVRANTLKPNDHDILYNLGTVYNMLDQFEKAIEYFNEAEKLRPNDARNHYERGRSFYFLGRYEGAIKEFQSALKYNSNSNYSNLLEETTLYSYIADCYEKMGDFKKEIKYRKKAEVFSR